MKGILFLPLLWVIGYLVVDGEFGLKVINGFAWLNTLYYIMLWFISIVLGIFSIGLAFGGSSTFKTRFNGIGLGLGMLIWVFAVGMVYFYYWLTNEIMINTSAMATQWSELGSNDLIIIFVVIFIINAFATKTKKED